jgi:hypothetical protein
LFNVGAATQQLINKEKGDYRHHTLFFVFVFRTTIQIEERRREKKRKEDELEVVIICFTTLPCPVLPCSRQPTESFEVDNETRIPLIECGFKSRK